jgi:hypothetical protein
MSRFFLIQLYYGGQKILAVTILTFMYSVNKPLRTVTPLPILVILTFCYSVKLFKRFRYSKNRKIRHE